MSNEVPTKRQLGSLTALEREDRLRFDEFAHELKNPIVLMANAVEQCSWRIKNDNSNFQNVRAEVKWMTKFVDQLLEIARAEAGRTSVHPHLIFLDDLLAETISELQEEATQYNCQVLPPKEINDSLAIHADGGLVHRLVELIIFRSIYLASTCVRTKIGSIKSEGIIYVDFIIDGPKNPDRLRNLFSESPVWPKREDRIRGITGLEFSIAKWIAAMHGGCLAILDKSDLQFTIRTTFPERRLQKKPRIAIT